jgi:hypothetical protein
VRENKSFVTLAVFRCRPPDSDTLLVSGLWLNSHSGPSAEPAKESRPVGGGTVLVVETGIGYDLPHALLTLVMVGQPSVPKVMGATTGMRPPG